MILNQTIQIKVKLQLPPLVLRGGAHAAHFDLNVYTDGTTIFDVDVQNMPKAKDQNTHKLKQKLRSQTTQNKEKDLQHPLKDCDDQDARTCILDINVKYNNTDARTCVLTTDDTRDQKESQKTNNIKSEHSMHPTEIDE